jgi:large subunit ribosomal protein L24
MAAPARITTKTKVPELRKGDTVIVLKGRDAGKRGVVDRVIRRDPASSATRSAYRRTAAGGGVFVVVDGINIAKRHTKPRQTQSSSDRAPKIQQGGILDLAQPVPIGKVMLVCSKCDQPTRIGHQILDNGRRVRVCRHCGEQLEVKGT